MLLEKRDSRIVEAGEVPDRTDIIVEGRYDTCTVNVCALCRFYYVLKILFANLCLGKTQYNR